MSWSPFLELEPGLVVSASFLPDSQEFSFA